tara:strand:+ start:249 stop:446 length:198 start_codon:yes stop_codon:yes gene_type:complete
LKVDCRQAKDHDKKKKERENKERTHEKRQRKDQDSLCTRNVEGVLAAEPAALVSLTESNALFSHF